MTGVIVRVVLGLVMRLAIHAVSTRGSRACAGFSVGGNPID